MSKKKNLGAVLVAVTAVTVATVVFTSPAAAASRATNVFLANLVPNVDFLDRSSRFALTNSASPRIKAFAHDEARAQTLAANDLDAWIEGDKRLVVAAAAEAPLLTGRSVAIDGRPAQAADMRLPMGQEDLDSIEGLNGADFDAQYKDKQLAALSQIETDYATYIAQGDDPVLLALANRELPKVRRQLADLRRL